MMELGVTMELGVMMELWGDDGVMGDDECYYMLTIYWGRPIIALPTRHIQFLLYTLYRYISQCLYFILW